MTSKEFISLLTGWDGKSNYAIVKIQTKENVSSLNTYICRAFVVYLPFYVDKRKIKIVQFQIKR